MTAADAGPIVFAGDSITDAGRREDREGIGHGYVRTLRDRLRSAGVVADVVNAGVSGDRMVDLQARWADDILARSPSVLTVYIGINDTWRRYDSGLPTSAEDFHTRYRECLVSAVAGSRPALVLMEPFVLPVTEDQRSWHEDLDDKRERVAALAAEFGATFVPLQRILASAAEEQGARTLAEDGVHPTPLGARMIAEAWIAARP